MPPETPFRVYSAEECGDDGYPLVWHRNDGSLDDLILATITGGGRLPGHGMQAGIKHLVRARAGHRCQRCRHPFVVGESGTMEGPMAVPKGFAAELGVNQETLDEVLGEVALPADLPIKVLDRAPRTNWSPCDLQCRHGGPVRARVTSDRPWEVREDEGPEFPLSQGNEAEAAWRVLTVHHLDEVKANLRWWNLVALCQRCHLLIQRKVTMEQPWPWEHTPWFRPHAAAWYALRYRNEDLDREATMARLSELLDLGTREEMVERMPL